MVRGRRNKKTLFSSHVFLVTRGAKEAWTGIRQEEDVSVNVLVPSVPCIFIHSRSPASVITHAPCPSSGPASCRSGVAGARCAPCLIYPSHMYRTCFLFLYTVLCFAVASGPTHSPEDSVLLLSAATRFQNNLLRGQGAAGAVQAGFHYGMCKGTNC